MIISSSVTATVIGYDGSMMNALNILPSYTDYFELTTATLALNTAAVWLGAMISGLFYGKVVDWLGRKMGMCLAVLVTIVAVALQAAAQNIAMFTVARILIGIGTGMSGLAGPVCKGSLISKGFLNYSNTLKSSRASLVDGRCSDY